jgi:hypothetical protein
MNIASFIHKDWSADLILHGMNLHFNAYLL